MFLKKFSKKIEKDKNNSNQLLNYYFQAHGNYAFGYSVNDGHASSKSQSEVGTGGHKASAYNSHINHVAPVAPIVHAAPAVAVAHAAPLVHAAPLAVATPVAYSSVVNHVAAAPVVASYGILGAGHLGYGNGILGHGLLAH